MQTLSTVTTNKAIYLGAEGIARERLNNFLDEKLSEAKDTVEWEFYTFLLEQAKKHELDMSGYCSLAMQDDEAEAKRRFQTLKQKGECDKESGTYHFR